LYINRRIIFFLHRKKEKLILKEKDILYSTTAAKAAEARAIGGV